MKLFKFRIKSIAASAVIGCLLIIAGCGNSSTLSSSGGGVSLATGPTMVKGNITGFSTAQVVDDPAGERFLIAGFFKNMIASQAIADDRVIEGIKVCIGDRCALTDAAGVFEVDLTGIPGGEYDITFSYGGKTYKTKIEVVEDALVILEGVSISGDGVVRVNNIIIEIHDGEPGGNVAICHYPGDNQETLEVPESTVPGHKEHGDYLGECKPFEQEQVYLCHEPGPGQSTIKVAENQVSGHKEHGDYLGECKPFEEEKYAMCHFPGEGQETILVIESKIPGHKEHGDYLGECKPFEEEKYAMCHFPGEGQETILVTESKISGHKEHGDYLGECEPI